MADIYDALEEYTGPLVTAQDDHLASKLLFHLSRDETEVLGQIFEHLDSEKDELKITGFTLAETTLQDMLLLLNHVRFKYD